MVCSYALRSLTPEVGESAPYNGLRLSSRPAGGRIGSPERRYWSEVAVYYRGSFGWG
jgi:hypothetical protein